ncbi:MAG: hypothetical protein QM638_22970 [Nocardioides sp.]|uniref:hypothetical protein n=1 Tax=Nocardioides sp. TaxID=35761 RepID=UPI0039E278EF
MPLRSDIRQARWLLIGLVVILLVAAGLAVLRATRDRPSELEQALGLAPRGADRYSFTDWAAVRRALDADVDADSSGTQIERFLSRAFDRDLSPASTLTDSAVLLQRRLGWSPATLVWELLSQSTKGAVVIGRLPDSVSFDSLRATMRATGLTAPSHGDVWDGSEALYQVEGSGDGRQVTPLITYVALVPDQHLVITGDDGDYVQQQVDALEDTRLDPAIAEVADAIGDPTAAYLYSGDYACAQLSLADADTTDQSQGKELVAQAGKVNPYDGFALASEPDGTVVAAMAFESHDQAVTNADTRATLAVGPAVGQGGSFTDRFRLGTVNADGPVVRMELHPKADASILSDLGNGPLLFATC